MVSCARPLLFQAEENLFAEKMSMLRKHGNEQIKAMEENTKGILRSKEEANTLKLGTN